MTVAVVARMFGLPVQTLQYWYKHILSDYFPDIENKKWHPQTIETVDKTTGEITNKPVYVFNKDNIGSKMSIDDKAIGHDCFTIFSNHDTGKIALMVESTTAAEIEQAMELFGEDLKKVQSISMDMSATYSLVADNQMPLATQVIDKFHVMKYVYDAVKGVRGMIRKELTGRLSKGKKKTDEDKQMLSDLEVVKRVRYAITQSPDKWSDEAKKNVDIVFDKFPNMKKAYHICQSFKSWYSFQNRTKSSAQITKELYAWYQMASELKEFDSVVKMINKHEDEIINFFKHGMSNARAECLNGKIERFVSSSYGIKDKDFILYRIAGYFS